MKKWTTRVFAAACALLCGQIVLGGENAWTQVGPNAGTVDARFSANPAIAYARGGDRLYKSTDGGATWSTKQLLNPDAQVYALDPSNANVLIVASGSYGLRLSVDGGDTFTPISNPVDAYRLRFSGDGSTVYSLGGISPVMVRRSTNRGASWSTTPNTGLPMDPPGGSIYYPAIRAIGIDPFNANTIYIGIGHPTLEGIYKSTDGGANFTPGTGLLGSEVRAIEVSYGNSNHVFAATGSGLYRSTNGGATWALVPDPTGSGITSAPLGSIALDPNDSDKIYVGDTFKGEIFRSTDGGASWSRRDSGVAASVVISLSVRPGAGDQILAATSHALYRTTNAGQSWNVSSDGIQAANVSLVRAGEKFYVGLYDGGVYESDNVHDWRPLNNTGLRSALNQFSEIRAINDFGRLFVLTNYRLASSNDEGASWSPSPPSFNYLNNPLPGGFLTLSGTGPTHLATTNIDVEITHDDGATWTRSSTGLPMPLPLPTKFAKNEDGSEIYVGTWQNGVYKSINGGQTWTDARGNLAGADNLYVPVLAYDDNSRVLVIGTNDGAFVTRDGGASYTPLASPTPGTQASVRDLLVEDFDHGSIFLMTYSDIYRSVDKGATWTALPAGETPTSWKSPTSVTSDAPGRLYLGSLHGGVENFTIAPDIELITNPPAAGVYSLGQQVSWSATVRNNGPHAATLGRIQVQVTPNVSLRNITTSRGACSPVTPGNLLECDLGVLQPGDTANIALNIRGNSGGTVQLEVNAFAAETDSQPMNNTFIDNGVKFIEQVDLAATLTSSVNTVNSSETFEYTLTVRNNGPETITGAHFQSTFAAGDLYTLTSGSMTGCNGSAGALLDCPLPSLASGQSRTWRWTVTAVEPGARNGTVTALVNPDASHDSNPANNNSSATLQVLPSNDLELALTANSNAVTRGTTVTYTLNVTNRSLTLAPGVTASLTLNAALGYVNAVGAVCAGANNVVTCELGGIASMQTSTVSITVSTLAAGATNVSAQVTGGNPDPDSADNSAAAALTIAPLSDLGVTLTSGATSAVQNTSFAYTLIATNAAGSDATGATAQVTLSNLLTYVSATGATCTSAANVITCALGSIGAGGSVTVTLNVNAVTVGTAASSASVAGVALDPAVINNAATAANVTITAPPPPPPPPGSSSGGGSSGGGGGSFDYASAIALLLLIGGLSRARRRLYRSR